MFTLQDNQVANLELALVLESGESKMWEMNINDHEELKKEDSLNETQISIMMLLKTLHDAYYSSLKPQHPVELF